MALEQERREVIGARIKQLREERHLTQPVVADRVGVTLRAYQEWEAGGGIKWENVEKLAGIFDVTPDFVLTGPRPEPLEVLAPPATRADVERLEKRVDELAGLVNDLVLHLTEEAAGEIGTASRSESSSGGSARGAGRKRRR